MLYAFFIYVILSSSMQAYYDENGDMNERPVLQARAAEITDLMYSWCNNTVYYQNMSQFTTNLRAVLNVINDSSLLTYLARYGLPYPTDVSQSAHVTYEGQQALLIEVCHICLPKQTTLPKPRNII